jgi:crotonobetainyl-CoA:carnitine CoA-transferase CaiB-like acyl-CoA transferase
VRWNIAESNSGTGLPLEGLRVLDLSRVLAGPLCAMVVGDLGADVIKVESPAGDPVRELAPPRLNGLATYYLSVNRHRRNVTLDLSDSHDVAKLEALVAQADAVIENYLPYQRDRFGLERIRLAHPDVIWVSVTPASGSGPLANEPTFDLLAQARSGLMSVTGESGGDPTKVGAPLADVVTGLYAAVGLLAALVGKLQGRHGRHIEAPLLESTMTALVNQMQGYLVTEEVPGRLGNHHPSIAPYGPVQASDGLLLLAVGTDAQFGALNRALEGVVLREHPEWATNEIRVIEREALHLYLDECFATQSVTEWLDVLMEARVPCAPIYDVAAAVRQPQIADSDFVGTTDSVVGPLSMLRSPLRIDGKRPELRSGPRGHGQDNDLLED